MKKEQPTFKAGDEVYCPNHDLKIHEIKLFSEMADYPLLIEGIGTFTSAGKMNIEASVPHILHATPENKALLEALYKCEFESPKLKGSDLTRKLLSEGKHVLCYISQVGDLEGVAATRICVAVKWLGNEFKMLGGGTIKYAVPCNDYDNLVDGVLTLKSEQ